MSFICHTDVWPHGLSCTLYHTQDDNLRVIGYDSKILNDAEGKYNSSEQDPTLVHTWSNSRVRLSKRLLVQFKWCDCELIKEML